MCGPVAFPEGDAPSKQGLACHIALASKQRMRAVGERSTRQPSPLSPGLQRNRMSKTSYHITAIGSLASGMTRRTRPMPVSGDALDSSEADMKPIGKGSKQAASGISPHGTRAVH